MVEAERQELDPRDRLAEAVASGDTSAARELLEGLDVNATVRAVSLLEDEERGQLLTGLEPQEAAELLELIPEAQAVEALEGLAPETAARIVEELASDEAADLIGELEDLEAEAILRAMDPAEAAEVRELATWPEDSAGGLMITEFLEYGAEQTVEAVVDDLRANAEEYREYDVQYAYVNGADGALAGVLPMRDLLLAPKRRAIGELMIRGPLSVRPEADLEELEAFFDEHDFFGVPVVDAGGRILGIVRRRAVREAMAEETEETYRRSQGIVGGEELRSMPLMLRSRRRLAWLSVNIVLNVAAASVIAAYQDTLQQVIALAVFLPILSDMSGCSGAQAVAVSMRELTLGVIQSGDLRRVIGKELMLGLVNGLVLGLLLGGVAWIWKGNPWLGLVVGAALAANTVVAVCIGGGVPLALKALGRDPALASGPILTTVTDMCGFFLALSLASLLLERLV